MANPVMYRDFGTSMVTVEIGEKPHSKDFQVHKNLVCRESDFFRSTFEGVFVEASRQHLKLPEEHIDVFEAFCDWLYSRQIRETNLYTSYKIPNDLFWLRMYTMADRHNNLALQMFATAKITSFSQEESVPSVPFIAELFENLMPKKYLEHYVVRHVAVELTKQHADWKIWTRALKANDRFGAEVAVRVAKINPKNYTKSKLNPQNDARFETKLYDEVDTDPEEEEEHQSRPLFMILLVPRFDGQTIHRAQVTALTSVAELKIKIQMRLGIPALAQSLAIGSTPLREGRKLHEYNIQKDSRILVAWIGKDILPSV